MADLIFDGLNTEQRRAVETLHGPVLIIAGAGSGKTRALTHRIANLIENGIPAWQILAVTFTNKAANEMKGRIESLLHLTIGQRTRDKGLRTTSHSSPLSLPPSPSSFVPSPSPKLPVMGTFHSICARMLRRDIVHLGRNRDFVIYDTDDQEKLMREVLKSMYIDPKELKPRTALAHVGHFKSEAMRPKDVLQEATTDWMARIVKVYEFYQTELLKNNALDFDDLLLETVRLLRDVPTVRERYQNTWQYINVDEYQDTNHVQYMLLRLLAEKHRNLCVIGDPDQSIYAFRGADIRNILEFQKEYADAAVITLERNYRSTQQILDSAGAVIATNPNRPPKHMWTERIDGEKIAVQETVDEKEEAAKAIERAMEMMAHGTGLCEQVILYRTNAQSRLFEEACMKAGVPYRIVGGVKFYSRREVKDVLAYLRVIHNSMDSVSLIRILNVPSRKIGKTTIERLQAHCQEKNMSLWEGLKHMPDDARIASFVRLVEAYHTKKTTMTVAALANALLKEISMEAWVKDDTSEGEERWENIGELLTVMRKYDKLAPELSLTSFLEEVALVSEIDRMDDGRSDALTLMTLHLCKGLEFSHVMIAGCEEGLIPHANALFDRRQLEEERRLMYVGMTRAKDRLSLFLSQTRVSWGSMQANEPSRFLDDLPLDLTERRSTDLMSSTVWASFGRDSVTPISPRKKLEPYRQRTSPNLEFNQDVFEENVTQDTLTGLAAGSRLRHTVFGNGTITEIAGDIATVQFDSGKKKKLALNIAPIEIIEMTKDIRS